MNLKICFFMDCWKQKGCLKHFLYIKIEVRKASLACSLRISSFQRSEAQKWCISFSYSEKIPCVRKTACISCHHFGCIKSLRKGQVCKSNNLGITAENITSCAKNWSQLKHHVFKSICIISRIRGLFWELPVSAGQPQASKCLVHLHPVRALLW